MNCQIIRLEVLPSYITVDRKWSHSPSTFQYSISTELLRSQLVASDTIFILIGDIGGPLLQLTGDLHFTDWQLTSRVRSYDVRHVYTLNRFLR